MVRVVQHHRPRNQERPEYRRQKGKQLPHQYPLIAEHLELAVQVQAEEHEAGEGDGGVSGGPGLESVLDVVGVRARADFPCEIEAVVAGAVAWAEVGARLADVEEVGSEAALWKV